MKRMAVWLCVLLCSAAILSGCSARYREADFLGKTSAEIAAENGPFDCETMPAGEDGLYRNCRCGYTIREAAKGFLQRSEEELFFIVFDENGVASDCETGPRPGG